MVIEQFGMVLASRVLPHPFSPTIMILLFLFQHHSRLPFAESFVVIIYCHSQNFFASSCRSLIHPESLISKASYGEFELGWRRSIITNDQFLLNNILACSTQFSQSWLLARNGYFHFVPAPAAKKHEGYFLPSLNYDAKLSIYRLKPSLSLSLGSTLNAERNKSVQGY